LPFIATAVSAGNAGRVDPVFACFVTTWSSSCVFVASCLRGHGSNGRAPRSAKAIARQTSERTAGRPTVSGSAGPDDLRVSVSQWL